ncbi:hypothetical protein [Streptomyces sp. MAI_2237]
MLALGLGATIETGHAQGHSAGARVVADDRGPTVITSHASFASVATPADDRGPTVIAAHASSLTRSGELATRAAGSTVRPANQRKRPEARSPLHKMQRIRCNASFASLSLRA